MGGWGRGDELVVDGFINCIGQVALVEGDVNVLQTEPVRAGGNSSEGNHCGSRMR